MRISDWSSDVCSSDLAAYSQRPRPSSGLEGPHDDQNDNGDNRDAGHFIGQAQRLFADPPLTPGEGSSEARQPAVITAQQQHQEQLGVQPALAPAIIERQHQPQYPCGGTRDRKSAV